MTVPATESTEPIVRLLAERIGLDAASVGENLIRTGIRSRMNQLGVARMADYERILHGPGDEVQALIEEVVIPESWFFRDDRPFAAFREVVRSGWIDRPERAPLSVLCLPCAGGEEPYSVVMTLLELGLPRDRFEVVAVDVSERSVHRAARGIYGINSFRGVPEATRLRYFDETETPGRYLIKASIRAGVQFQQGNILTPDLLGGRPAFAIVFCRNLLIYFDDAARGRAARNLDRLTAPGGFLFLGHADRPDGTLLGQFALSGRPGEFLYRRRDGGLSPQAAEPPLPKRTLDSPPGRPVPVVSPPPKRSVERSPAPGPRLAPPPVVAPGSPPASTPLRPTAQLKGVEDGALGRAASLADQGRYIEATELIRGHLGRGPLDAAAHFLLGMIHQAAGDRAAAEAEMLKAVYLDPDHEEALLALALLARRRGDVAAEALLRRRAERVRTRKGGT